VIPVIRICRFHTILYICRTKQPSLWNADPDAVPVVSPYQFPRQFPACRKVNRPGKDVSILPTITAVPFSGILHALMFAAVFRQKKLFAVIQGRKPSQLSPAWRMIVNDFPAFLPLVLPK
jgi:hypothetical protein